jgi:uncharacterized SAM-binding protein YcdF (DUF218 family)
VWLPVLLVAGFAVSLWRDPRKFRTGLYLLAIVWLALMIGFERIQLTIQAWNEYAAAQFAVATFIAVLVLVVVLGVFLVLNGVTMFAREGHRLANLLGGLLGLSIIAYVALGALALRSNETGPVVWYLASGLPVAFLGFGFAAFLVYGSLYVFFTNRLFRKPDTVVVLGAGLIRGRVTRLLANRLDRGQAVYRQAVAAGKTPQLVTSGGQGDDEPLSEAAAMADYLGRHGFDRSLVKLEDRSRTTEENLVYTKALLGDSAGRVAVVTNNFHAFRAALLMRQVGLKGHALGAPTAGYFWPSAVIREYAAILWSHKLATFLGLGLTLIPLAILVAGLL